MTAVWPPCSAPCTIPSWKAGSVANGRQAYGTGLEATDPGTGIRVQPGTTVYAGDVADMNILPAPEDALGVLSLNKDSFSGALR